VWLKIKRRISTKTLHQGQVFKVMVVTPGEVLKRSQDFLAEGITDLSFLFQNLLEQAHCLPFQRVLDQDQARQTDTDSLWITSVTDGDHILQKTTDLDLQNGALAVAHRTGSLRLFHTALPRCGLLKRGGTIAHQAKSRLLLLQKVQALASRMTTQCRNARMV
jgi:hypothetical protein